MAGTSTDASDSTTQRPKRQSCDRCHSQKVRCTRSGSRKTGNCDRCLRKGSKCIYSSCLPKGRPALYRASDAPATASSPNTSTAKLPDPLDWQPGDGTSGSPGDADGEIDVDVDMDMQSDAFAIPPYPMGSMADLYRTWWPEYHFGDGLPPIMPPVMPPSDFHLHQSLEPSHPLSSLKLSDSLSGIVDNASTGRSSSSATHVNSRQRSLDLEPDLCDSSSETSISSKSSGRVKKDNLDHNIANLSRLSMHLSQLLCFSRTFLAEALHPPRSAKNQDSMLQIQQGIKLVFKSVNSWLVHGSSSTEPTPSLNLGSINSSELLQHLFSASNYLLEILRQVRAGIDKAIHAASTMDLSKRPQSRSGSILQSKPGGLSSTDDDQRYSIVRHLVLVCATLLLNMYIAILVSLQHSADILRSSIRKHQESLHEPAEHMDAASRAHMQLVSIVQLTSYHIKRQNQTLDATVSSCRAWSEGETSREQFDTMSELKMEVEQHLRQLEQILYIIS
ncbi:hypothetical protein VHEMI01226 [[Torrubiella] hemipterigena]|uniref:Zn(2)-C6 fungal-type domain-containing protein n=1 Tax=[Torrubiella] hemipterigena TaxID=1531966 RepID=A0A0A1SSI0_9HYPO|nr:hypothetical protein VHEMI01226 [[Torrubiella] hemipterigena]